jgi:hypothetical protein
VVVGVEECQFTLSLPRPSVSIAAACRSTEFGPENQIFTPQTCENAVNSVEWFGRAASGRHMNDRTGRSI